MYPLQSAESEGQQGAIQGKRRCHVPCGHISECTDELPPTIRKGAIQGKEKYKNDELS